MFLWFCGGVVPKIFYLRLESFKIVLYMYDNIMKLSIGSFGIAATEIVQTAPGISPEQITAGGNLIIQLIIAVFTIFGLFRKKRN